MGRVVLRRLGSLNPGIDTSSKAAHGLIHRVVSHQIFGIDQAQSVFIQKRLPHGSKALGLRRRGFGAQGAKPAPDRNPGERVAGNLSETTQRRHVDRGDDSEPEREVGVVQRAGRVAIRGNRRRWWRSRRDAKELRGHDGIVAGIEAPIARP